MFWIVPQSGFRCYGTYSIGNFLMWDQVIVCLVDYINCNKFDVKLVLNKKQIRFCNLASRCRGRYTLFASLLLLFHIYFFSGAKCVMDTTALSEIPTHQKPRIFPHSAWDRTMAMRLLWDEGASPDGEVPSIVSDVPGILGMITNSWTTQWDKAPFTSTRVHRQGRSWRA